MTVAVVCDRCTGPVDMEGPRMHANAGHCRDDTEAPGIVWQYLRKDWCRDCAIVVRAAMEATTGRAAA